MKSSRIGSVVLACSLLTLLALAFLGCELQNTDSITRTVGANFSGLYTGANVSNHVSTHQSGDPVTTLNLRQSGDQLEATDNHGLVFRGTVGDVGLSEGQSAASFTLKGQTTAGKSVDISGNLTGVGTEGTMKGSWIEPDLYGDVYATGTINPAPTNGTSTFTLTVNSSPSGAGTVSPGTGSFAAGTTVTLVATPSAGHTFTSWSGNLSGSNPTNSILMDAAKTVTANFSP